LKKIQFLQHHAGIEQLFVRRCNNSGQAPTELFSVDAIIRTPVFTLKWC